MRTNTQLGNLAALPPTRWTVVSRAGQHDHPGCQVALDFLARLYRPVLLRYLTAKMRVAPHHAEDLVQAFFLEKVLGQNILSHATPHKGRLRSYLLKTFSNYATSQLRAQAALKRRPTNPDAERVEDFPELSSAEQPPPESFDVLWAKQVVAQTVALMREACRSKERAALWQVFEARILGPLLDGSEPLPYEALVVRFSLRSPSEASNLLITAKRMFARLLHEVVRETVADDCEVDTEITELKRILSK